MTSSFNWSSYDPVAETYASVAAPAYFAAAAQDLVSLLGLTRSVRWLDVGAGTGAVTSAACRVLGERDMLVAVDPAVMMLRKAVENASRLHALAGALPAIPFRGGTFDVVTMAFVLSHLADPEAGLREIARVLSPGGQIGISSWATGPALTPPAQVWQAVVEEFIEQDRLQEAMGLALPYEGRFAELEAITAALASAGFQTIRVEQRSYDIQLSTEAFVQSRLIALPSRFMQSVLSNQVWQQFVSSASRRVIETLGSQLTFNVAINLSTARRSAAAP